MDQNEQIARRAAAKIADFRTVFSLVWFEDEATAIIARAIDEACQEAYAERDAASERADGLKVRKRKAKRGGKR